MSEQSRFDEGMEDDPMVGTFIVHLRAGTGESIVGSIGAASGEPHLPFNGWLDFIAAVNTLRAAMDSAVRAEPPES
jgi:hypothetical protein